MARKVFFSFHYKPDNWRAAQVRSMGIIEGNEPCSDNDWESVADGGHPAIEKWVASQLKDRTCCVVLVGHQTAGRKWITHEIKESWNCGMGIVGIRIHNLKNRMEQQAPAGANPFDHLHFVANPIKYLSSVVKLYDPPYLDSKRTYGHICENLDGWIEEAINIRKHFNLSS